VEQHWGQGDLATCRQTPVPIAAAAASSTAKTRSEIGPTPLRGLAGDPRPLHRRPYRHPARETRGHDRGGETVGGSSSGSQLSPGGRSTEMISERRPVANRKVGSRASARGLLSSAYAPLAAWPCGSGSRSRKPLYRCVFATSYRVRPWYASPHSDLTRPIAGWCGLWLLPGRVRLALVTLQLAIDRPELADHVVPRFDHPRSGKDVPMMRVGL
jgi:hypothetical protein